MRNYLFLCSFLSLFTCTINSQNLVPNPGFETAGSCPSNNIFTAANWYNPNTASPDYFNPCGSGSTVPPAVLFGPHTPHSGSSFAGGGWYGLGGGFYDYMQVQLTSSMTAGAVYSVSMWVCLAPSVLKGSDDIGIYISNSQFKSTSTSLPAGYTVVPTTPAGFGVFTTCTPQIKCPNNQFITDMTNWTLVNGTYTATGGEQAITIGCFEPWATTGTVSVNSTGNDRCYYYIDDVSVEQMIITPPTSAPPQPVAIDGATTACPYSTQIYSVAPVAGATSYSWNIPIGWTGFSASNTIAVTTDTSNGIMDVSAINSIGASASQTLGITITNFQATVSLANSVLQTSVAGTYQWLDCATNSVIVTGPDAFTPAVTGSYAVIITQNGCVNTSSCINVGVLPAQPGFIAGASTVCAGSTQQYSIAPALGANSYSWALPQGWSGTSVTNTISVTSNSVSGTLSVTALNQTGQSATQTLAITVNSVIPVVTQTAGVLYSITNGSYQWIDCSTNSVVAIGSTSFAPAQSGNYALVISDNGCVGTSSCTAVITLPLQPGSIAGTSTVCAGSTHVYSVLPVAGATSYLWVLPAGFSGSSTTNSIAVTAQSAGGTLSVSAVNQTGQSPVQTTNITVNTAVAIITQTAGVLYSNAANAYQWLGCDLNYSVVSSGSNTFAPVQSGNYAVTVNQNGCLDTSACIAVNVIHTGLASLSNDVNFSVFPNPADDFISIQITKTEVAPLLVITDYTGKSVYKEPVTLNDPATLVTRLAIDALAPGIYFIQLIYPGQQPLIKKITVIR